MLRNLMVRRLAAASLMSLWTVVAWAAGPIQTQSGMSGDFEVDIMRSSVKDDVLTVYAAYRNTGDKALALTLDYRDVYYLDTQDKKKYGVLQDSKAVFIANPRTGGYYFNLKAPPGGKQIVWIKFPGPPPEVTEIDLALPDVLPFDDLPVSR